VIVDTSLPPTQRNYVACLAVREFGLPTDILVLTPAEVERLSTWRSGVVADALREGKVLHEAA
jgi:hypothetical protein